MARDYLKAHLEPEVMLALGKTWLAMGNVEMARTAFQQLVDRHPDDFHAKKAQLYIDYLNKSAPRASSEPAKAG